MEWLAMLIPLIMGLMGTGGNPEPQTQATTSETTNPRYRSPALGISEPAILSALFGNAQAMGGAGMPGGVSRFGPGASTMFNDIIGLLSKEWPTIMDEYGKTNGTSGTNRYGGEAGWGGPCERKCKTQAEMAGANYSECYQSCMKNGPDK